MSDLDKYLQGALPALGGWLPTELPRAAVLCPILSYQGRDQVLFVLRPEGTQVHAGQIAFPGGMHAQSESPLETALRESLEEVGAPGDSITPLGELEPRESSPSSTTLTRDAPCEHGSSRFLANVVLFANFK